ncbi:MAG: VCBS repeat-containing protein [Rhodocyclales bacterium GT-UBC]|nr:MAG: VCBS repeat-containing protein [Rhodocyclales bacterium GT-UBC]
MKIANANLQMASSHLRQSMTESRETLKAWVGQRRPDSEQSRRSEGLRVSLSDQAKSLQSSAETSQADDKTEKTDPKLALIRSMLEYLTGRKIDLFDGSNLQTDSPATAAPVAPPPNAGYGIEYDLHQSHSEFEQTSFSASGSVTTADGKTINFDLQLTMQRSFYEETNLRVRIGDAAKTTDPLVLNFNGNATQLTDQRFAFDLNSDGSKEQINFVRPGSGFLAFDRNHDGAINNGSELFGPNTGDGFAELAELDNDKNGWIDENDTAYQQLKVWRNKDDGEPELQSLKEAGVGAISLNRIETPFQVKNNANQLLGEIRSSGIFLQDDGRTGTIQQIDLTV